jgi:hypothetical protein
LEKYVSYENNNKQNEEEIENDVNQDILYEVEKYEYKPHLVNIKKAEETQIILQNNNVSVGNRINADKSNAINTSIKVIELPVNLIKIEKYQLKKHSISLKK